MSLGVSTVETNRDQDFLICRDQLLKLVEIILSVKTRLLFSWSRFLKSRLLDCRDKLFEIVKIFLTVESYFLPLSRWRASIKTTLRKIEAPRLRDREIEREREKKKIS